MTAAPAITHLLRFKITVTTGANVGQTVNFEKPVVTIGRGAENDLVFPDDSKMSRSHVEIHSQGNALKVINTSQKNFILINDDKCEEKEEKSLNKPFVLQVGETILKIDFEPVPEHPSVALQAKQRALSTAKPQPLVAASPLSKAPAQPIKYPPPSPSAAAAAAASAKMQQKQSMRSPRQPSQSSSRFTMYIVVAVLGLLGWWLFSDSDTNKKADVHIRTEGDVARAIEDSANAVREIKKKQETSGQDSLQYKSAQEHYIKGFRDYRAGQYARAMQSFQASLSFYPNHELARKYLVQSQRKFEQSVDSSMSIGRKYYQKQNFKMCQGSFANVMIMLRDPSKPKYKEAKQLYEECSLRLEGRF